MKEVYIFYDSLTGQTRAFAERLGYKHTYPVDKLKDLPDGINAFLCTRSIRFGEVTGPTKRFLRRAIKEKHCQVIGTAVSGNRNWGHLYGEAGRKIEKATGVPLWLIFEASGLPSDVKSIQDRLKEEGYENR